MPNARWMWILNTHTMCQIWKKKNILNSLNYTRRGIRKIKQIWNFGSKLLLYDSSGGCLVAINKKKIYTIVAISEKICILY